jgi:predicted RNA-binding protein with PUA-like domain
MKVGDTAFIYHSNDDKSIVGLAKITKEAYQEPGTKEDWSVVEISFDKKLSKPVTLSEMKSEAALKDLGLIRQSRLSVSPATDKEAKKIKELAGL